MKLGRLPADPALLASLPQHKFGAAKAPAVLNRKAHDFKVGMFGNDQFPDCTAASLANAAIGVASLQGYQLIVDADDPLAFYCAVVGITESEAATSDGAEMAEVLLYQDRHGFNIGPQSLVCDYKTVALDRNDLALSMAIGPAWWGVQVYERDMDDFGKPWDAGPGINSGQDLGGHAITAWDYTGLGDTDIVRITTWGAFQPVTWRWVEARLQEAHSPSWLQLKAAHI